MSAESFEFRFRHQNEEATWYKNANTKFALPDEDVNITCDDSYLNENQFLEMARRFFIACGYTEQQWKGAIKVHLNEVETE